MQFYPHALLPPKALLRPSFTTPLRILPHLTRLRETSRSLSFCHDIRSNCVIEYCGLHRGYAALPEISRDPSLSQLRRLKPIIKTELIPSLRARSEGYSYLRQSPLRSLGYRLSPRHQRSRLTTYGYLSTATTPFGSLPYTTLIPSIPTHALAPLPTTQNTMARKLSDPSSDSSLSPPSEGLSALAENSTAIEPIMKGTKRKAEATVTKTSKRTRKIEVGNTVEESNVPDTDDTTLSKRRATTKVKYEETVEDEEKANGKAIKATKAAIVKKTTRTTKKKNAKDEAPLEERTNDTKLRVGAHVSTAGGETCPFPSFRTKVTC